MINSIMRTACSVTANNDSTIVHDVLYPARLHSVTTPDQPQILVVIDPKVVDYQALTAGLVEGAVPLILSSDQDGVEQITEALQRYSNVTTLHLVAHGSPGSISLGNTQLNLKTLGCYTLSIQSWFSRISPGTSCSIALYGCNVAAEDAGARFLAQLHSLTKAVLYASSAVVGNNNWDLEVVHDSSAPLLRPSRPTLPFHAATLQRYTATLNNIAWATVLSSSDDALGGAVSLDDAGNVYTTNGFSGTVTLGSTTLTSAGMTDALVTKRDSSGNILWATQMGGSGGDNIGGISIDSAGNAYALGSFINSATFGSISLSSRSSGIEHFIVKLSSNGSILWAKKLDDFIDPSLSASHYNTRFSGDDAGNVYITGTFSSRITFGSTTLTATKDQDSFIIKLDSSGNLVWAKKLGGFGQDNVKGVQVDEAGNLYVAGEFTGTATYGDTTLTSAGSYDTFVLKLDSSGNVLWATKNGGTDYDFSGGLALDSVGNIYSTGYFWGTSTVGNTTLTSAGGIDAVITKFDSSGSVVWVSKLGGANDDYASTLGVDSAGNIYSSGGFNAGSFYDPNSLYGTATIDSTTLTSTGYEDAFILRFDSNGNVVWATTLGGPASDNGSDLSIDSADNVYVRGYFTSTATIGDITFTGAGKSFGDFLIKFAPNTPPTSANKTINTNEDTLYTFNVADFSFLDVDNGDVLRKIQISTLPPVGTLFLDSNENGSQDSGEVIVQDQEIATTNLSKLRFQPTNGVVGVSYSSFGFRVSDGSSYSTNSYGVTLAVNHLNDAPLLADPIADQTITANQPFNFSLAANTFVDEDAGDSLVLAATLADSTPLPDWLSFSAMTASFSGTPGFGNLGNLSVKVVATDSQGAAIDDEFVLNIEQPIGGLTPPPPIDSQGATVGDEVVSSIEQPTGALGISTLPILLKHQKSDVRQRGTNRADVLRGSRRNDVLLGGGGDDTLISGIAGATSEQNWLYGGDDNDRLVGGNGKDLLDGGRGNDWLNGGKNRDLLLGGDGIDRLIGGQGDDILVGSEGNDRLTGSQGKDTFVFNSLLDGVDTITDFNSTEDLLDLRPLLIAPELTVASEFGQFSQFVQLQQIGFDTEVRIDADGMGKGTATITLATLKNVVASDVQSMQFLIK